MVYVATINIPGYMPMADEPAVFESSHDAWKYLADEIERAEMSHRPDDWNDESGPWSCTETFLEVQRMEAYGGTGTVYGPSYLASPDEDTSTDLGLAYSVEWSDEDSDDL